MRMFLISQVYNILIYQNPGLYKDIYGPYKNVWFILNQVNFQRHLKKNWFT